MVPHVRVSERGCDHLVEVPFPQAPTQFVACLVAVPVPLILHEIVEVVNFNFHVQITKNLCIENSDVAVPQVSRQYVARFDDVPTLLVLEGNVEAASLVPQQRVQRTDHQEKELGSFRSTT